MNDKVREAFSGSEIAEVALAIHARGKQLGWFALSWDELPYDSKQRYEELAVGALMGMKAVLTSKPQLPSREELAQIVVASFNKGEAAENHIGLSGGYRIATAILARIKGE